MRQHLDRLWRAVYPDGGACPSVDPRNIQARVSAALDGETRERSILMKKRLYTIAVCAALAAALMGTAFAVYYRNNALTFFSGDTALIEPAVQAVDETLEGGGFRVHIDSVLSDSHSTVLGVTVEALTDEARDLLNREGQPLRPITGLLRYRPERRESAAFSGFTREVLSERTDTARSYSIYLDGVGAPDTLHVSLAGSPEKEIILELEDKLESLTVTDEPVFDENDYFIRSCTLNAAGLALEVQYTRPVTGDRIVEFCFRMADGSLKTLNQILDIPTQLNRSRLPDAGENVYRHTVIFHTLIDPLTVSGVLMNGKEYSFLTGEAVPAEIPETMRPFLTPFLERGDIFHFSAADVCRHIGACLERNGAQYIIRYLDTTLTVPPGQTGILVNGEPQTMEHPPLLEGEELLLPGSFFRLLSLRGTMFFPTPAPVHAPECWLVTP